MSIATYAELQAAIGSWMKRSDLTSLAPDFVALAESRINRDLRLRRQIKTATLTTVAGVQSATLPTDYLEFENLTVETSPPQSLSVTTPEILDRKFPEAFQTGVPVVYAPIGNVIRLGPTPDAAYSISADYYGKWAIASDLSNWLLTNAPMVYLAACLVEASLYTLDDQATAKWEARYQAEVATLQKTDDESLRSGSAMRVRTA